MSSAAYKELFIEANRLWKALGASEQISDEEGDTAEILLA
jgi:hypothetical protein